MTIRGIFGETASRHFSRTALTWCDGKAWRHRSWGDAHRCVRELAEGYGSRFGLRPGVDNAAIILQNSPVWVESYLAQAGAGV